MASKRNLFEEIRAGLEAYRDHPRSLIERGVSHRERASQRVPRSMDSAVCDLAKGTPVGRAAAYSTGCPMARAHENGFGDVHDVATAPKSAEPSKGGAFCLRA
jgi:hypothetical protein